MIIQCREKLFEQLTEGYDYELVQETDFGGYIDCFDKDWIFLVVDIPNTGDLQDTLYWTDEPYIVLIGDNRITQQGIPDEQKYLFLREVDGVIEKRVGFKSYLKLKEVNE